MRAAARTRLLAAEWAEHYARMVARANFLMRIGEKEKAITAMEETITKTVALGQGQRSQAGGRWRGLDADMDFSDDQQDIARGRDMVDSKFQGFQGQAGTHNAIMTSTDYIRREL